MGASTMALVMVTLLAAMVCLVAVVVASAGAKPAGASARRHIPEDHRATPETTLGAKFAQYLIHALG